MLTAILNHLMYGCLRSLNFAKVFGGLAGLCLALANPVWGQTLLSLNQPTTASGYQSGNAPGNGNDGNLTTTRWAAAAATYPQWWQVDLGATQTVAQAVIYWYNSSSRAYQYQIQASNDNTNYAILINNTNNTAEQNTTNGFFAQARYIRIYVTGCSTASGYASFYECQVYGPPPLQPYAADANTLCLFHLDEAAGSSATTNWGSLGGTAYSVSTATAVAVPPVVTNVLGGAAFTNFGKAATFATGELLGYDYNRNGDYDGDVSASELSADSLPMSLLNMGNGGQTPWTLEAMICPAATNANQEILCTDSSASATTSRGFQFRLDAAGQLELNLIAAGADIKTAIPTLATDAVNGYVTNTWYHVAAVYDGTNVVLYWTKVSPTVAVANAISTNAAVVGAAFGTVQGALGIGNRTRGAGTESFQGEIDEVRISNLARSANAMLFSSNTLSVSGLTVAPANPVYAGTPVTLSGTVSGSLPITYAWQSDGGSGGLNWTNFSNASTNIYDLDTTSMAAGTYEYRLVVANADGVVTGAPGTLVLLAASGPVLVANTTVVPAAVFAGNTVTLSAAFAGTQPMSYQWFYATNGGAFAPLAGATNMACVLASAQTNNSGAYFMTASNNPPGLGAQSSSSRAATLAVWPTASPESGMYCELLEHPEQTTITAANPKFGWNYVPSFRNDWQAGYRLIVASSLALAQAGTGDLWDSGLVASSNSLNVVYAGSALPLGTNCFWRVQTQNAAGQWGGFSAIQQFNTASQLFSSLTAPGVVYQPPASGNANCYPLRYATVTPVLVATNSLGHWFIDFGNDGFGYATVQMGGGYAGTNVTFLLGELATNNVVSSSPGATIRCWSGSWSLQAATAVYTCRSTTAVGTISPPAATYGIVSPFRYLELAGVPAGVTLTTNNVTQQRLQTEFNDQAATFSSSSAALNSVWSLCQYSMKALSFDGIFVDGDRERTPYEADTYFHMMSAYGVNNDFTQARCTFEYLTNHLTWPTEWKFHLVFAAWADYQQTGDPYLLTKYYGFLTNSCLMLPNAGPDGLLLSYPETGNTASGDIIDWYRIGSDGTSDIDGYVAGATNAVINAFYYRCLTLMTNIAQLTGHAADVTNFAARAVQVYSNYNRSFWNSSALSYVDGESTTHASAPANYFPLAFGLVPASAQTSVVNFLHTRIAANNGIPPGVYGAQYLLEGLFLAGDAEVALGLMTTNGPRGWLNMINIGSTLTDEAWSVANKSNEDWNHAWGAAPGNLIPRYVLGVRPLAAGFGQILIQPQLGQTLSYAQGIVPTIRGPVAVAVTNGSGGYQLTVNIPGNVTATVMLPALGVTNAVALVDGQIETGSESNNWLTVTGIGSGPHAIWLSTNNTVTLATRYANWAASWFGTNAANSAIAGPSADPDGDGLSNYDEFIAGTDPLDAASRFAIVNSSYAATGPVMSVQVQGQSGRQYTLQHTFSLQPASWVNTGSTQTATADGQAIILTDATLSGSTEAYLRVLVTLP
jgi:hypothetical protein